MGTIYQLTINEKNASYSGVFPHQEHMAMVITEADIEAMVKEVVRRILEAKN